MEFIINTIISGLLYDIISKGVKVTFSNVFSKYDEFVKPADVKELLDDINKNAGKIQNQNDVKNIIESNENYTSVIAHIIYKTEFAKRLDYCMSLINRGLDDNRRLNIDKLSLWLGYKSSNDIKKYYIDTDEAEFEFEKFIANKLGINVEWMQTGNGHPFKSVLLSDIVMGDILKQEELRYVKDILFLCHNRKLIIIEKIDEYKYLYVPHAYVFNANVGASGMSELYSLYCTLKELQKKINIDSGVYEVTEEMFTEILHGETHLLTGIKYGKYNSGIIQDFLDLYNNEEQKENYERKYGTDFIEVQNIIKHRQGIC